MFAHYTANASGYCALEESQKVRFEIVLGATGPQAENIHPV